MTTAAAAGRVGVHLVDPGVLADPARRARYDAWLTPEERDRVASFRRAVDRDLSLGARALCRSVLARELGVDPGVLRFTTGSRGRPELGHPDSDLRFNLSHTSSMVAGAFARGVAVGVDVERLRPGVDLAIARRYFTPEEAEALDALPEATARERFFELWTLKEAWLKARGDGVAEGLARGRFAWGEDGLIAFDLAGAAGTEEAARWRFLLLEPGPGLRLAVALRAAAPADAWAWSVRATVPGERDDPVAPRLLAATRALVADGA